MLDLSKIIRAHYHITQEVDSSWYEKYISKYLLRFLVSLPAQLSLYMVPLAVSKAN